MQNLLVKLPTEKGGVNTFCLIYLQEEEGDSLELKTVLDQHDMCSLIMTITPQLWEFAEEEDGPMEVTFKTEGSKMTFFFNKMGFLLLKLATPAYHPYQFLSLCFLTV